MREIKTYDDAAYFVLICWWLVELPKRLNWGYTGMCEPILMDFFLWGALFRCGGGDPLINVALSAERSSNLNVETEPRVWRGPTHECLNADWSLLMNVETEPGMWRGAHSWMSKCRKVTTLECWNWARDVEGAHSWMPKCRKVTALECWISAWDVKGAERLFTLEYWNWTKVLSSFTLPDIWTKAVFTLDVYVCVCVNVTVKFNIMSMENVKNGFRPILCVCVCVTIDTMLNLMVTLTETQTQTSSVNTA